MKWPSAGSLLLSVFLFTRQLYFTEGNIGAVIIAIPMVLASLDLSAGGRLFGAAVLCSANWAVISGGIIVRPCLQHAPATCVVAV